MELSHLGLSDPEQGINSCLAHGDNPHMIRDIVEKHVPNVEEILGHEDKKEGYHNFSSQVLLLEKSYESVDILVEKEMNIAQVAFSSTWNGYTFEHGIIDSEDISQISSVLIDSRLVGKLKLELGENFSAFEESIGLLYAYANHDYTSHRYGLATTSGPDFDINKYLSSNLQFKNYPYGNPSELLSGVFHLDLINEISESSDLLMESIELHTRKVLTCISQIKDSNIKEYCLKALKYPLFSVLSKTSTSGNGRRILESIQNDYQDLDLSLNGWGKTLHIEEVSFQNQYFPVREFRKQVMNALRGNTIVSLTEYLEKNGVKDTEIKESSHLGIKRNMDSFFKRTH